MSKEPSAGQKDYEDWAKEVKARPSYEREAAVVDLWLALADARRAAGLTQAELAERMGVSQAQVARIEKLGYDSYTLKTLRRYVAALGDGFRLDIAINVPEPLRAVLLEPNPLVQIAGEDEVQTPAPKKRLRARRALTAAQQ